jgi:serine/threonine protein kinase
VLHYAAIRMTCPSCAHEISASDRFCPSCGHAVDLNNSPTVSLPAGGKSPAAADSALSRDPLSPARDARIGSSAGGQRSSSPSSSSGSGYEARYVPGATLAARYRIVSPLGKGGMGEVYRAEDMKLGQTVALKFLPQSLAKNAEALAQFTREVRLTRQISHPNVCRVFDLGEISDASGNLHTFLTMEFVDGEDLASLMRRIGRLPRDKALDIAHQMCAGLAAAHDQEIIHRDLKPANVMLDGRGRVRITDFGLAEVSAKLHGDQERAGTPAYMSPEQFSGGELTAKSDLYSLGLVMYEIFTGKRPFTAATFGEMAQLREKNAITLPSHYVKEVDALVDQVIMRCLEKNPGKRPASALQISAALPGGDPLAAAIAAGETPSPEMVAAAGTEGALAPWTAIAVLAGIIALLFANVFLSSHGQLINLLPVEKSPEILQEDSQNLLKRLGYDYAIADSGRWVDVTSAFWAYNSPLPAPGRYRDLAETYPSPANFNYRLSPRPFETHYPYDVSKENPPDHSPGDAIVGFDAQGQLKNFSVIPVPPADDSAAPASPPSQTSASAQANWSDWPSLFSAAGLDYNHFKSVPATWYPDTPMDQQFSWEGAQGQYPVRVRSGTFRGRPVFFSVLGLWDQDKKTPYNESHGAFQFASWFSLILASSLIFICVFLSIRNIRMHRSDIRGAIRASGFLYVVVTIFVLLSTHWGPGARWKWDWWQAAMAYAGGIALQYAAFYLGIEPYFRRTWPELMISWSRLLAGGVRNALVGRDLLLGVLFGVLSAALQYSMAALPYWFRIKNITPSFRFYEGLAPLLGDLSAGIVNPFMNALGSLAVLFLMLKLFRRKWMAVAALSLFWVVLGLQTENPWGMLPLTIAIAAVMVICTLRSGILGLTVALYTQYTLTNNTLTLDFSRWYAPYSVIVLLVFVAIALYGFFVSLGGRKTLARVLAE